MTGLLVFGVAVLYVALCVFVARALARRTSLRLARWAIYGLGLPILVAAPLVDEIVGKYQFDKLCRDAEEIEIYGTISVGEDFYTTEGKWRLDSLAGKTGRADLDQSTQLSDKIEQLLRYEHLQIPDIPATIPINGSENRVFSRSTGQQVAMYRIYGTRGGWLSRNFEKPLLVRDQCIPKERWQFEKRVLHFDKK